MRCFGGGGSWLVVIPPGRARRKSLRMSLAAGLVSEGCFWDWFRGAFPLDWFPGSPMARGRQRCGRGIVASTRSSRVESSVRRFVSG